MSKTFRTAVYVAIDDERNYQERLYGKSASSGKEGDGSRSLDEFVLYISGYADKLQAMASVEKNTALNKLHVIRKIAALCVACMEQHGAPHRSIL